MVSHCILSSPSFFPSGQWFRAIIRETLASLRWLAGLTILSAMLSGAGTKPESHPAFSKAGDKVDETVPFWLETSLNRVFPGTKPGNDSLELLAARNSRISFQACLKNLRPAELHAGCQVVGADSFKPRVRYVGLVVMQHLTPGTELNELDGADYLPGLVPDPLWPLEKVTSIGPNESRSFWITLQIPADAKPGIHGFKVKLAIGDGRQFVEMPVKIEISELVVQPRKNFRVTHWWRGEATWDYYKTGMFDQRWWDITKAQMEDMLDHGSDVVFVPMFFSRRETFKRPCQLLIVNETKPGVYDFDWSQVKQFTDMCKKIGFKEFEWPHMWIYWGVKNPMRIYTKKGDGYEMLWDPNISGFSDTYQNFLKQLLPQFHDFLVNEDLLKGSYFHLSDEPSEGHLADYKRARQILRELAPWMKVMDALSHVEYGRQHLTDIPIPIVSSAQAYVDEKIPHWVYYCCSPTGPWLNRFMDTPLAKIRMSGMLFYKQGAQGFLHWGFNYWHKLEQEALTDPFADQTAALWPGIPAGDPFMIYPGPNGEPLDSIRWEVFAESLQDYAILQSAGIKPDDAMLSDIKTYANFPKNEKWIKATMGKILRAPNLKTVKREPE